VNRANIIRRHRVTVGAAARRASCAARCEANDGPSGVLFRAVTYDAMGWDGMVVADGPDRVDAFYQAGFNLV
jgi:hypothetical protein